MPRLQLNGVQTFLGLNYFMYPNNGILEDRATCRETAANKFLASLFQETIERKFTPV